MANTAADVLKKIKEEEIEWVDLRFTDPKGKWQHLTMVASVMGEDEWTDGLMFDGSSIAGWKAINESDMKLMLDPASATIDPFFAQTTLNIVCDVVEPLTDEPYDRAFLAFAFLLGMHAVVSTTGDMTSVLFGVPGEATSAALVVDGYAMTRRGEAGRALGAALMVTGVTALLLVTVWGGHQYDWVSPQIIGLSIAGIALVITFVWHELRIDEPIVPMEFFHSRVFSMSAAIGFIVGFAMLSLWQPTRFELRSDRWAWLAGASAGAIGAAFNTP